MGCGVSSAGGGADTESRLGREHSEDDGDEDSHLDFRLHLSVPSIVSVCNLALAASSRK